MLNFRNTQNLVGILAYFSPFFFFLKRKDAFKFAFFFLKVLDFEEKREEYCVQAVSNRRERKGNKKETLLCQCTKCWDPDE